MVWRSVIFCYVRGRRVFYLQLSMQTKNHLSLKDSSGFLSMELLSRFELETSSLPRMRSTN